MIFTFYSFKGGVGRSMAMAGVAYLLARRGLRVLVIDFDLEAPGLERYFFDSERARGIREQLGLVDLVQTYKLALTSEAEFKEARFRSWWEFVCEAVPSVEGGGSVDLMTSGRREPEARLREYALAVRTFDWQDFFFNWKGERFFDWLRTQLLEGSRKYDVVLVDSRTGVTEMGGVCAYQLADAAVMFCAANNQNIEGTLAVANDFRSDAVLALRHGHPLEILVIPARLEEDNPRRQEFLEAFESKFGREFLPAEIARAGLGYRDLAVPYDPRFAIIERLVGEGPEAEASPGKAVNVFQRLAHALTLLAQREGRLKDLQPRALAELTGAPPARPMEQLADPTRSSAGYDVFLDYEASDREAVRTLMDRLESEGLRVWMDARSLEPGVSWGAAEERALDASAWLLVLFGGQERSPDGARSAVGNRERLLGRARRLGRPRILPVFLRGAVQPRLLELYGLSMEALVLEQAGGDGLGRLVRLVKGKAPIVEGPPIPHEAQGQPYPGDLPFTEDQSGFFFGREREVAELVAALREHDLVLISGPAGVGKTSLVQAGLLPQLRLPDEGARGEPWQTQVLDLGRAGAPDPGAVLEANVGGPPRLLVLDGIDSFPEPGSYAARAERLALVARLVEGASQAQKVVLVWRDVFDPEDRDALLALLERRGCHLLTLEPLGPDQLAQAVEKPAGLLGHLLEPGLVERLKADAGDACCAVAQLQRVLPSLWKERRRGWLTNKGYEQVGLIGGPLGAAVEAHFGAAGAAGAAATETFVWNLLQLDAALQLTAARQPWREIASIPVVARHDAVGLRDQLAARHLIDLWREAGSDTSPGRVLCALVQRTPRAYGARFAQPADPDFTLWRRRVAAMVQAWEAGNHSPSDVLTGGALAEAERMLATHEAELREAERSLIVDSVRARVAREEEVVRTRTEAAEARATEEHRLRLRTRRQLAIAIVLWLGASAAALVAERSWRQASAAQVSADSERARATSEKAQAERERDDLAVQYGKLYSKFSAAVAKAVAPTEGARASTRIHIYIGAKDQEARAQEIARDLQTGGISVGAVQLGTPVRVSEVRYFRGEDKEAADRVAGLIGDYLVSERIPIDAHLYKLGRGPQGRQLDIWFALGTLGNSGAVASEPQVGEKRFFAVMSNDVDCAAARDAFFDAAAGLARAPGVEYRPSELRLLGGSFRGQDYLVTAYGGALGEQAAREFVQRVSGRPRIRKDIYIARGASYHAQKQCDVAAAVPARLWSLASAYSDLRASEPAGSARTARMTELFDAMRAAAAFGDLRPEEVRGLYRAPQNTPGMRIAALAAARAKPSPEFLQLFTTSIQSPSPGSAFEQYQALLALSEVRPSLSPEQQASVLSELRAVWSANTERIRTDKDRKDLLLRLVADLGGSVDVH